MCDRASDGTAFLVVEQHEGGGDDVADAPGAETDPAEGFESHLQLGVGAFGLGADGGVQAVVGFLVVGELAAGWGLDRDTDGVGLAFVAQVGRRCLRAGSRRRWTCRCRCRGAVDSSACCPGTSAAPGRPACRRSALAARPGCPAPAGVAAAGWRGGRRCRGECRGWQNTWSHEAPGGSAIFSETVVPGSLMLFWQVRFSACRSNRYVLLQTVTRNGSVRLYLRHISRGPGAPARPQAR
jgi:hypothetical protein